MSSEEENDIFGKKNLKLEEYGVQKAFLKNVFTGWTKHYEPERLQLEKFPFKRN